MAPQALCMRYKAMERKKYHHQAECQLNVKGRRNMLVQPLCHFLLANMVGNDSYLRIQGERERQGTRT